MKIINESINGDDNFIIFMDNEYHDVYAVIRTKRSTNEIEKIIQDVKDTYPEDWSLEDIYDALPADCFVCKCAVVEI